MIEIASYFKQPRAERLRRTKIILKVLVVGAYFLKHGRTPLLEKFIVPTLLLKLDTQNQDSIIPCFKTRHQATERRTNVRLSGPTFNGSKENIILSFQDKIKFSRKKDTRKKDKSQTISKFNSLKFTKATSTLYNLQD